MQNRERQEQLPGPCCNTEFGTMWILPECNKHLTLHYNTVSLTMVPCSRSKDTIAENLARWWNPDHRLALYNKIYTSDYLLLNNITLTDHPTQ